MNTNLRAKIITIGLYLLLVANLGTMFFFWWKQIHKPPPPEHKQAATYITKELGLDSNQQLAFKQLIYEQRAKMEIAKQHVKETKDVLFDLLKQDIIDSNEFKKAVNDASNAEGEMNMVLFDHFRKLRQLCRGNQQQRFDHIIKQVLRMMSPKQPPPPPRKGNKRPLDGEPPPPFDNGSREDGPPPMGEDSIPPNSAH